MRNRGMEGGRKRESEREKEMSERLVILISSSRKRQAQGATAACGPTVYKAQGILPHA